MKERERLLLVDEIQTLFAGISPTYDRLNAILSLGLDRHWRRQVVRDLFKITQSSNLKVLDACTGTGDLALLLAAGGHRVIGADFCGPMLAKARKKTSPGISPDFIEANVNSLPYPDGSFHAVTSAFSLRNLPDLKETFSEAYRVLAPGGIALFLDLTRPHPWIRPFHAVYLKTVLPAAGRLISGSARAYGYLAGSILNFPEPEEIARILRSCSFRSVTAKPLTLGICTLWTAHK